jgi:hypothetical protein
MSTVPPTPPPGFVPPSTVALQTPPTPPLPPTPTGYTRSIGISFSPRVVSWLPVLCLTLALISTFFGWVGAYVGGHPVYSQGPWRAMLGTVNRNFQLEEQISKVPGGSGLIDLDKVKSDWELMVPYLFCLILAVVVGWVERGTASLDPASLPPPLRPVAKLWPYRNLVLVVLATIALVLLIVQISNGFGLQRAAKQMVAEKYAQERKDAVGSQSRLDTLDFKEEQEYAKYNLERTIFLYAGLGLQILALLAIIIHAGLDRRGAKPPPRIVLQY